MSGLWSDLRGALRGKQVPPLRLLRCTSVGMTELFLWAAKIFFFHVSTRIDGIASR